MSMIDCLREALRQNHIDQDEHDQLVKKYTAIAKMVADPSQAKQTFAAEILAEAEHRKRVAGLVEAKRTVIVQALDEYRNAKGQRDPVEAFIKLHERLGREGGSFVDDAETKRMVIRNEAHDKLTALLLEFKKGLITGDLRRRRKAVAARMDNVIRELFGENSGDETAKALAQAWTQVSEDLRLRFNAAGGTIGKLEKWGMPQGHDAQALLDFGKNRWIDYMMRDGVLDRDRMENPITKRAYSDEELRESLSVVWDRITTDGWIDREITGQPTGRGALWTQHADHRFLHFKNADAWIAYAKKFGNPDAFASMTGHINRMARDIAHMETFGANPNVMRTYIKNVLQSRVAQIDSFDVVIREQTKTLKELQQQLTKPNPDYVALTDRIGEIHAEIAAIRRKHTPQLGGKPSKGNKAKMDALDKELFDLEQQITPYQTGEKMLTVEDEITADKMRRLLNDMRDPILFADKRKPQDYLNKKLYLADTMWELQRGAMSPVNQSMANLFATTRNIISASSLGAAWLSSLSDPAFGQDMRLRFGMGMARANFGRIAALVMKDMITKGSREDAIKAGLGLDAAVDVMHRTAAENRTIDGRAWSGFVADRVLAIGALSPWTQAGKHLAGLDLMGYLADISNKNWTALGKQTQQALQAHGITAPDWEIIRKAEIHEPKSGARYLRPAEIEAHAGRELAERYLAMILRETRYAVPETSVQARAMWMAGRPGTLGGELWRSMMQFKGFGMTVLQLHTMRIAREIISGDPTAIGHATALILTSGILGAVAMGLKDIKDGRDPRKWLDEKTYLDPQFWGAAVLQAGGFGLAGDLLFSNTGRHGQNLSKTIAGPMMDRADNLLALTTGNVFQRFRGEKTNIGRESVRFLRQNIPGANLWPIGLVLQRKVFDELQKRVDPEAYSAFSREQQLRLRDYRQQYWWRPGESAPSRAPDIMRSFATR